MQDQQQTHAPRPQRSSDQLARVLTALEAIDDLYASAVDVMSLASSTNDLANAVAAIGPAHDGPNISRAELEQLADHLEETAHYLHEFGCNPAVGARAVGIARDHYRRASALRHIARGAGA
jgi:hypothetical protein